MPVVGVIMGSDSDLPVMQGAIEALGFRNLAGGLAVLSGVEHERRMNRYGDPR